MDCLPGGIDMVSAFAAKVQSAAIAAAYRCGIILKTIASARCRTRSYNNVRWQAQGTPMGFRKIRSVSADVAAIRVVAEAPDSEAAIPFGICG
jgi:hypothetical protein